MEQIAAADWQDFLQEGDQIFETLGVERCGIEQEEGELADHVAGAVASEDGVSFDGLQGASGVVIEDELQESGECGEIGGVRTEESGGAPTEVEMFGRGSGGEPVMFAEKGEDVVGGEEIFTGRVRLKVTGRGHRRSLARIFSGGGRGKTSGI